MHTEQDKDIRSTPRSRCRLDSAVRYMKQIADCRIINISRTGIAIELYTRFSAATGSTVSIESDEIGLVEGIVRWNRGGRLGIQFRANSNSSAKVAAYFRNFHQDVHPVLRG
ncbi:PilZ domain-containing protein [Allorhizobium undicola]|uniref:PilZ domain-containing protein n=1 Tax=Allorhizobium undicola TaxID=78527 RepID=UPI003D3540B8